jgi:TfoX/Sxy family transcriptional regulator of competence genes
MAYDGELAARIRELIWDEPDLTEKQMFGGLAFLIGGHMAVVVSRSGGVMVRVRPAEREKLLSEPGASPFEMRGREMAGFLRVHADALEGEAELQAWVARGLDGVYELPPKD